MFKDDYKNQMDNIKPDGFIKDKIRRRLSENQSKGIVSWKFHSGRLVATALSLVLVFTLGAVIGRRTAPASHISSIDIMESGQNYDKIYSTLGSFKESFWDRLKDDYVLYEEEIETTADSATKGTGVETDTGTNGSSHSETTTQVSGVDEADIVKTDGEYIYILSNGKQNSKIKIVEAGNNPKQLSDITVDENVYVSDMYLQGDRLVLMGDINDDTQVTAVIYDISNPHNPEKMQACTQSGYLNTSRLIGNKLYVVSNYYVDVNNMVKSNTKSYVPYITCDNYDGVAASDTVYLYDDCNSPAYTVISAFNIEDSALISTQSILGGTQTVYASLNNIIIADNGGEETQIARFEIMDGEIKLKASAKLNGNLLNQFSIDEYNDHFRFVLTEIKVIEKETTTKNGSAVEEKTVESTRVNSLVILDADLKETGKITDIAPNESVYSVRFMGDTAYFVTFRQVDPLFSADLSDPANPKIIGALKIPGFSNYLFPYGEGKLLGIGQNADENTGRTQGMKLSMFDISDPSNVTESHKTDIPAVYSEALYNHKAVLCDYSRNIIAFSAQGTYQPNSFFVYSYEKGEFVQKLQAQIEANTGRCRGIYIGKIFYIVNEANIYCYDMSSFELLNKLELK